ncbi:RibD family protein [Coralloluteibacterium thermophilus]|uniref:RibD family protein n=1 Tax=Coralloluteibacterium thermophilum TaxID=2707049 RepID=A0ABV9NNH8_9GAMM
MRATAPLRPLPDRDPLAAQDWSRLLAERTGAATRAAPASSLAELYAPLVAARELVVAQVGQSLDGRVATRTGDARDISGPAGLRHLHRCRALVDAVVVGVGTVVADDPALTVRLVPGHNPVRVVLDPQARVPTDARLLHDGASRTLLLHGPGRRPQACAAHVERAVLPVRDGRFAPREVLAVLRAHGLRRVLVEGGACTIGAFVEAGCVDRLHVAIAPLLIGSGPSGIAFGAVERLAEARRPPTRVYDLGGDIVFDCDLRGA